MYSYGSYINIQSFYCDMVIQNIHSVNSMEILGQENLLCKFMMDSFT